MDVNELETNKTSANNQTLDTKYQFTCNYRYKNIDKIVIGFRNKIYTMSYITLAICTGITLLDSDKVGNTIFILYFYKL